LSSCGNRLQHKKTDFDLRPLETEKIDDKDWSIKAQVFTTSVRPIVCDASTVGDDVILPWGPDVQAPITIIFSTGTPTSAACTSSVDYASAMKRSSCSPPAGGAVLVLVFSTADAVVAPDLMVELITFAVGTVGDCSTGASFPLLSNTSWPEAFLALSDMAGVLCVQTTTSTNQKRREFDMYNKNAYRFYDLLGCRP
jgi:hypothetical protein